MIDFAFAVIAFLRETEQGCDILLRSEENAAKIADAQGKIAGCGLLTAKIKKHFEITDLMLKEFTEKYPCWTDFKMPTLEKFNEQLKNILGSDTYKAFTADIDGEAQFKKDWLWMKAEKGRDLVYVRGWKDSMQSFDKVIEHFQTAYMKRKNELQFDEEKKEDEEYEQSLALALPDPDSESSEPGEIAAEWEGDEDGTPPEVDGDQSTPVF
jgi:hypothetical protein